MPATWKAYGVDANNDGRKDPYNPVDAICAAANYLEASGAQGRPPRSDLRLQPRRLVRRRGPPLRPPVREHPGRPGQLDHGPDRGCALPGRGERPLRGRHRPSAPRRTGHRLAAVADAAAGSTSTRSEGASAIAVNDGTIQKIGQSKRLGKYVVLEDNYGNRFTYAELGSVAEAYPVPRERDGDSKTEHSESAARTRRQKAAESGDPAHQHRGPSRADLSVPRAGRRRPDVLRPVRAGVRAPRVRELRVAVRAASLRPEADGASPARGGLQGAWRAPSSARSDPAESSRRI